MHNLRMTYNSNGKDLTEPQGKKMKLVCLMKLNSIYLGEETKTGKVAISTLATQKK